MKKVKVMVDDSKDNPGNLRLVEDKPTGSQTVFTVDPAVWAYYTNTLCELISLKARICGGKGKYE